MSKIKILLLATLTTSLVSCGVKGRPIPPTNPAPIGRGQPTYKEKEKKKSNTPSPSASVEVDER